jgi:uncharacterized membrane protein
MDKKLVGAIIVLLAILIAIPTITADNNSDRSYEISRGIVNLTVEPGGSLDIVETYTYNFHGTYHGVTREIPIKDGEEISHYNVRTEGAYSEVYPSREDNYKKFTVYLYRNPEKTEPISNREVNVTYNYTFKGVTEVFNDVGQVQYKVWGDEWDQDISNLTAYINVPSRNGVEYWINPKSFNGTSKWVGNTLEIHTDHQSKDKYIEARLAIPRDEFIDNPVNASQINRDGLDDIRNIQSQYDVKYNIANYGAILVLILLVIYIGSVVEIYFKEGREPEVEYNAIYEREPPTDDSPTFINAMIPDKFKDVGKLNDNGFKATIMELINDGYLSIENRENITKNKKNNIKLKISDKDQSDLEFYQKNAINILRNYMVNGVIDFKKMENALKNPQSAEMFQQRYWAWKESYISRNIPNSVMEKYFINTGSKIIKYLSIVTIIVSIICMYLYFVSDVDLRFIGLISSIILFIGSIIGILLPSDIGGRWTKEGREFEMKWLNFKKYLNDFSLMKEYPPESIEIWNKYLVYGTALGVAKNVSKAMNAIAYSESGDNYLQNDVFMFSYYGGINILETAIIAGMNNVDTTDIIGDIGGGSGGGGGGAF